MTLPHLFSETPQQPGYWNIGTVIINPMGIFFFCLLMRLVLRNYVQLVASV